MKSKFLLLTPLWVYLTELPQIFMLVTAVRFNDKVDGVFKLYPLIVTLCLTIIFTMVYFFRLLMISNEEIRCIGLFFTREKHIINKGKTLGFTIQNKGKVVVELFEPSDGEPVFSWLEGDTPDIINVFRTTAYTNEKGVRDILRYFEVEKEDIETALTRVRPEDDSITPNEEYKYFEKEYEFITLTSYAGAEDTKIHIFFKETI